jgi:hypothetical protein
MRLMEAALATGGTLLNGDPEFSGVSTDSRGVAAGELFVALRASGAWPRPWSSSPGRNSTAGRCRCSP